MTTGPTRSDAAVDAELGSPASSASPTADRTADRTADLAARLDAIERTVTDGNTDFSLLEDLAAAERRVTEFESAVEPLTNHLDEMDVVTQVMRSYLDGARAVNEDIERRANTAPAKVESLESELVDKTVSSAPSRSTDAPVSEAASHVGWTIDGGDGSGSQRATETGLGTGTAVPSPESCAAPDSGASTDSCGDSADRELAARLRDAL